MKVAFFGTPDFATQTLRRLIDSPHEVVLVVSQPDKPAGRGRKLTPPPVKVLAEESGLPVVQPKSARTAELRDAVRQSGADVGVVVAYGKILPRELLDVPRFGFLNVHASLLPKYRGAAPIQWAVVHGEKKTGVSIMQIEEELDAGPVLLQRELDIFEDDDARSVHDALSVIGAEAMIEALDAIEASGRVEATPQDHGAATHAPLIERAHARIDWSKPAEEIIWLVRGFAAWPGAHTRLHDRELKIMAAEAADPKWFDVDHTDAAIEPGTVFDVLKGRGFAVKTGGDGVVLVTRVKPEGKKEMDADAAVNGGLVKVGARLASE